MKKWEKVENELNKFKEKLDTLSRTYVGVDNDTFLKNLPSKKELNNFKRFAIMLDNFKYKYKNETDPQGWRYFTSITNLELAFMNRNLENIYKEPNKRYSKLEKAFLNLVEDNKIIEFCDYKIIYITKKQAKEIMYILEVNSLNKLMKKPYKLMFSTRGKDYKKRQTQRRYNGLVYVRIYK